MSKSILQINFNFEVPASELGPAFSPAAKPIADTIGLKWKIWLVNEAQREAGGIYLFDDEASLKAYLAGPIVAQMKSNPALRNITVKQFNVIEELTAVTRGPTK